MFRTNEPEVMYCFLGSAEIQLPLKRGADAPRNRCSAAAARSNVRNYIVYYESMERKEDRVHLSFRVAVKFFLSRDLEPCLLG